MLESAHTDIADGLVYTVDGFMLALGRTASSNPAALSIVYPYVKRAASFPIPTEAQLRAVLEKLPTEAQLREIVDARRRSVHKYQKIEYAKPEVVAKAYQGVLAFWTAATIAVYPITGPLSLPGAFSIKAPKG